MKAFLLFRERDFDLQSDLPPNAQALTQDLELDTLCGAMALEDEFLFEVARKVVLNGLGADLCAIHYRQEILKDCLGNAAVVREIYDLAVTAIARERKVYFGVFSRYPDAILHRGIEVLQMFVGMLKRLKRIVAEQAGGFHSEGFTALFARLARELDDEYIERIQQHLRELNFPSGALISAELGDGNQGVRYTLRRPHAAQQSWLQRLFEKKPPVYTFYIAERDESGARALTELRERGINLAANALAQSADHILSFFKMLRAELAFYIGCLNLHDRLTQIGEATCFPQPAAPGQRKLTFSNLYDVCLALTLKQAVVGNELNADGKRLAFITGANRGGKSTFLRSVGLAHLMMQCGMFAPAQRFSAEACTGVYTHFKREEDAAMKSGKLDEELSRMSDIVDQITPNALLLCNESFAATNEREGSEIARQIVRALLEADVKVFFVTHLYDLARGFYKQGRDDALFLRAERQTDGTRTFKLSAGEPLPTSYGRDLYAKVFGDNGAA